MLSVIIATRNRADALKNVSLPSLLKQECCDFEIIVWDASDNEDSHRICENLAPNFKTIGVNLRYFSALRIGLTSQRNDAVKEAKGDFIFFIDDDSEVSPNGIGILIKAFHDNPDRMGIALPLEDMVNFTPMPASFYVKILRLIKRPFSFVGNYIQNVRYRKRPNRYVMKSAENMIKNSQENDEDAEWLSGCDMSFRKEVFETILFDERLQKFGGYALAEDVDLSHRVMLRFKSPLFITPYGLVRHMNMQGGRIPDEQKKNAALFFNRFILRRNFGMKNFINILYFQSVVLREISHNLITGRFQTAKAIYQAYKMTHKAIKEELHGE